MRRLSARERLTVTELFSAVPDRAELSAIAGALADLRTGLPEFRREAALLLAERVDHE